MFVEVNNQKIEVNKESLYLGNMQIEDIAQIKGLESLPNLKSLNLFNNRISRIENLEICHNLVRLNLYGNHI